MLVLGRFPGERIVITLPDGRRVTVAIVEANGTRVKIGIDAPKDVPVNRAETLANRMSATGGEGGAA